MNRLSFLKRLKRDIAGSTVIETALVMPVLLALSLGSFDVSRVVARQSELQKAANEAGDIALTKKATSQSQQATVKSVIMTSTGLTTDKVTVGTVFRCGTNADYVVDAGSCGSGVPVSTFVQVTLTDTISPFWTQFGLGSSIPLTVRRQTQVG